MNEEYDVIVLGTGLTVSAEFLAAGKACRPARGRGGWGRPGYPGLRLRVFVWINSLVVFPCLFLERSRERALGWVREARSAAAEGQVGRDWNGSSLTVDAKPTQVRALISSSGEIKACGR